jgi:hypothetical protein
VVDICPLVKRRLAVVVQLSPEEDIIKHIQAVRFGNAYDVRHEVMKHSRSKTFERKR